MLERARHRLRAQAEVIRSLLADVSDEQARWKPTPDAWSMLEVINHLLDEERDDFRARLQHLLSGSGEPFAPIDPPRWAVERRYNERRLAPSLDAFLRERRSSLAWLERLEQSGAGFDPTLSYTHPPLASLTSGDLLAAWVAHDLLHIRQLTKLQYDAWVAEVADGGVTVGVGYAGRWV